MVTSTYIGIIVQYATTTLVTVVRENKQYISIKICAILVIHISTKLHMGGISTQRDTTQAAHASLFPLWMGQPRVKVNKYEIASMRDCLIHLRKKSACLHRDIKEQQITCEHKIQARVDNS